MVTRRTSRTPRASLLALATFFLLFMGFPLSHVLLRAFFVNGYPSLHFFYVMLKSEFFRDVIYNSLNIALATTVLSSVIAYPLALIMARFRIPFGQILHPLLLVPLVVPPFVGAVGIRQLFGRFGSINLALLNAGVIESPISWLGSRNLLGIVALQTIHLVPILYLSIRASLANTHVSLEEAALMSGATRWKTLRRITIPLSFPGWFAGAVLVFISSFTDLGTPLVFEYRAVLSVQIFNMLSDLNENPVGYSFIVFVCLVSLSLFYLSKASLLEGGYASSGRTHTREYRRPVRYLVGVLGSAAIVAYVVFSSLPQLAVLLVALSDDWFMTVLAQRWTLRHFVQVLEHPLSARSLFNSLALSAVASGITVLVGFLAAYLIARYRTRSVRLLEMTTILPLAIPGIVFAFGYVGAFSGTLLDNRFNPFPLLIAAYIVRRMPGMVRSAFAGLQESSVALEEAGLMVGATPRQVATRILLPLMSKHLIVGAVLTFAYSMIEVSDGIVLAMEERFYPISKAIYALLGRPDGIELASALGSVVMVIMVVAFFMAERLSSRSRTPLSVSVIALFSLSYCFLQSAQAEQRELIAASPHWEGIRREFERDFSEYWQAKTGDTVVFRWYDLGGSSDIVRYLKTNFRKSPQGIGIDVMFGGGLDNFLELAHDASLEPLELAPEVIDRLPQSLAGVPLISPHRDWYAAALNTFGILYNKAAIARLALPTPRRWGDLAQPEYFDLVGAGDPRKSGSMHAMYEIILQGAGWEEGWRLIQAIAANVRNFSASGAQVGKDIATGEVIYGFAIDTYASDIIRRVGSERIGFVVPEDFPTFNGDGIAVLKGAPNRDLAQAFVEFVLSERGQTLFYASKGYPGGPLEYDLGKLPLIASLYGSVPTRSVLSKSPFTWEGMLRYDAALAGARWNLFNDIFGVFILDLHERMIQHVTSMRSHSGTHTTPSFPPIPLSEAASRATYADGRWGRDSAERISALDAWGAQARKALPLPAGSWAQLKALPALGFVLILLGIMMRRALR